VTSDPLAPVRYLDIVLVVLAAPFVVLMDLPALGYLVGAVAWIVQRAIAAVVERVGRRSGDVRKALGLGIASSMARSWGVALSILGVGLAAEREDGLTAALLVLAAFTVYLATSLSLRALERTPTT
jgi:hypothetical protein